MKTAGQVGRQVDQEVDLLRYAATTATGVSCVPVLCLPLARFKDMCLRSTINIVPEVCVFKI